MLDQFVTDNREEIVRRCRVKVELRASPVPTPAELRDGVPLFLDQLVGALQNRLSSSADIDRAAAQHGRGLQLQGFTVSQVVHDYGDVCQAITDLALERNAPISLDDFRTLNRCLDDAIASAVTEFGRESHLSARAQPTSDDQRIGFLAHEIRNLVNTAVIAFEVLKTGNVGVRGSTGTVLERSLAALRDLSTKSLEDIRVRRYSHDRVHVVVSQMIDELTPAAMLEAESRGLRLTVRAGDDGACVFADRQILSAVVVNLLQNAFKFTRQHSAVELSVVSTDRHVLIQVADECGGLPAGNADELFRPFEQRSVDRTGAGLGLAFCRWGTEVNDGRVQVRNVPGHGCVFTVDLPRRPGAVAAVN